MGIQARLISFLLVIGITAIGCESTTNSVSDNQHTNEFIGEAEVGHTNCQDTGIGLTAHYINEIPNGPLEITCDIGVYYNQNGKINNVSLSGTVAGSNGSSTNQYGIYVDGANVRLTNSSVAVDDAYPNRFVSIAYQNGASGNIRGNDVTGAHRAGILIRGPETNAVVSSNSLIGIGPKDTGWAQNGIQVDDEAGATIKDNLVEGHWWNLDNFVSTGIGIYSKNVNVQKNEVLNNDLGILLFNDSVNVHHNAIEITYEAIDIAGIYGILAYPGNNNVGIRQNSIISSVESGIGLGVFGTTNAKLIRNDVNGWATNLLDAGDETKLPKPFEID